MTVANANAFIRFGPGLAALLVIAPARFRAFASTDANRWWLRVAVRRICCAAKTPVSRAHSESRSGDVRPYPEALALQMSMLTRRWSPVLLTATNSRS